ncbi:MAG: hypothetical protein AABZ06_02815 [Bdellovibrionota bacterium]
MVFAEDFDSYAEGSELPAGWWCEGSRAVRIEGGRLRADANLDGNGEDYGASTVWLNKTYHITITKEGNRITFAVEGAVYLDKADDAANPEHKSGIIGFRTWHTDLWWDNVKVTELHR